MKYSWQRQIILETIQEHKEHLSAQQIYGYARERCPHISLGTVYRNLNTLADNDMIGRVGMISGAECFDWDPNSHEHFYCRKCHKIINLDLPEGELNALIDRIGLTGNGLTLSSNADGSTIRVNGDTIEIGKSVSSKSARRIAVVISLIVGLVFGSQFNANWSEILLMFNSQSFGTKDPQFGIDNGFYVFVLPGL